MLFFFFRGLFVWLFFCGLFFWMVVFLMEGVSGSLVLSGAKMVLVISLQKSLDFFGDGFCVLFCAFCLKVDASNYVVY